MADKSPAEKLKLKPGMSATILHAPADVALGVPEAVTLVDDPAAADFVLEFAATQAEAEERMTALAPAIGEKTVFWVAYPKGSKAKGLDISRDTVAGFARTVGLVVNANFSIDEVWSAVRARPLKPGE